MTTRKGYVIICDITVDRMKLFEGEEGNNLIQLISNRIFLSSMIEPPLKMCLGDFANTERADL
jgi:hypothetical protein